MKRIFVSLIFLFNQVAYAQLSPSELETKEYIASLRQTTLSFGIEKLTSFEDMEGQLVRKKIFSTIGSGVIFYVKIPNNTWPCIVTAKHVVFDPQQKWIAQKLNIRFNQSDSLPIDKFFGTEIELYDSSGAALWFPHPDSTIDLACILLDPTYKWPLDKIHSIPYSFFPSDDEYYEGKEVFVLGYPGAVGLDLLSRAVVRRGTIAWVPKDIHSGKKMLIDCNIFPGNSGGPVFSIPQNIGFVLSDTILQKPKFYGIVSQRRFSTNQIFSSRGPVVDSIGNSINSLESIGIGVIVTAKKVRELLDFVQKVVDGWVEEEKKKNRK